MRIQLSEEVVLPLPVTSAWDYLADTERMVELDPLLESYEPEAGVLAEGTTNRAVSRLGPVRMRVTTRTVELDPPHRAVFENVKPSWPLRITAEDTLREQPDGTLYRVTTTVDGAGPLGWLLVRPVAHRMMRTRRQLMDRILADLTERE